MSRWAVNVSVETTILVLGLPSCGVSGAKTESDAVQNRGYFGHNFPMSTLREFVSINKDTLTAAERDLLGASSLSCTASDCPNGKGVVV